jgi:hypothetical protein
MSISRSKEILMSRSDRAAFWQAHIDAWRTSGQSGRAYCQAAGINLYRFYRWRRQLGRAPASNALVPVEVTPPTGAVRILVGSEAEIVVEPDSSPAAVRVALEGLGLRL